MSKKTTVCSVVATILVVAIVYLVTLISDRNICTKLTRPEDVPQKVLVKLKEVELERGVYFFSRNFTDDAIYFAVCGGEEFEAGYDVKINSVTYEGDLEYVHTAEGLYKEEVTRGKHVVLVEEAPSEILEYSQDLRYPVVLFRIAKRITSLDLVEVMSENNTLPIMQWWGLDATEGEGKDFTYKIAEQREEIYRTVWDEIQKLELESDRAYVFAPCAPVNIPFDTDALYIVIPLGNENEGFRCENVKMTDASKAYILAFDMTLRRVSNGKKPSYAEGLEYPFAVLKIWSDKMHDERKSTVPTQSGNLHQRFQYTDGRETQVSITVLDERLRDIKLTGQYVYSIADGPQETCYVCGGLIQVVQWPVFHPCGCRCGWMHTKCCSGIPPSDSPFLGIHPCPWRSESIFVEDDEHEDGACKAKGTN